ncbi:MAG TPA: hypothetical protein DCZ10_08430 [Pelotomaculum sp.]|nr:hypothetical protein [Pelotomaculum sp.]
MIHKAFKILSSMAQNQENNTINALSKQTGIPKSTVHRILAILAEEEIVTLWPGRGYVLTPKLLSLGFKGLGQKDLLDVAIPIMRDISEQTKETVSINVICGTERICVYRIEGKYPISNNIKIGNRGPLLKGAVGKVIAAKLSRSELMNIIEKYLDKGEITNEEVPELLRGMEKVKECGYAVSVEERMPGCASVAVPIFDISGQPLAALSISTILDRIQLGELDSYLNILRMAVEQISYQMGNPQY